MEQAFPSLDCTLLGGKPSVDGCISKLPDDILCHILSFLDLKEAFRTRLLTRRWRNLCVPVRHLMLDSSFIFNFDYISSHKCKLLSDSELRELRRKFVDKVHQLLNLLAMTPQKLISFGVSFNLDKEFASNLDEWVKFAVRMKCEKVDINIQFYKKYYSKYRPKTEILCFPCHLLPLGEGSSLKHLRLRGCLLSPPPELASRLNSLQSLSLTHVPVKESDIEAILSGCLNLERLELVYCSLLDTLRICGKVPRLKWLSLEGMVTEIELSSINLESFKYSGLHVNFSFSNVLELSEVTLMGTPNPMPKEGKDYLFEGLGIDIPNLQKLLLVLSLDKPIPANITEFGCLKQLGMRVEASSASDLLGITNVLNASPQLEKFYLCGERPNTDYVGQLHSELKHVQIVGVCNRSNALELIKYLLNNAVALEEMTVEVNHRIADVKPDQVHNLLLKEKVNPDARLIVRPGQV